MKVELNVLFKKMQRDDKKEVLEFHVMDDKIEIPNSLLMLAGNMAMLNITSSNAGALPAEFKSIQRDSKKVVLKFEVKGDSQDQLIKMYPFAGNNVNLVVEESQMSLEEFEEHEGIEYNVDRDGSARVNDPNQMRLDDLPEEDPDDVLE